MIKVAIVGAGSAGMVCASTIFGFMTNSNFPIDLTIISDPKIPPISVGESMSPVLFGTLDRFIGITTHKDSVKNLVDLNLLPRIGARHTWENDAHQSFDVNYSSFTAHFDSAKFGEFIRKRLRERWSDYREVSDTITKITQDDNGTTAWGENDTYQFDYIFDCRGFPSDDELNSDDYDFPSFETVNSLLVFQHHHPYTHPYTDITLHENGWQFGINTATRKAFGYLYNNNITSKEEALEHYLRLNKDVPIENPKSISWRSYSAKKAMDNRVIKMGNRLYFYEPIQGIPLHYYCTLTLMAMDLIMDKHSDWVWEYRKAYDQYLDPSLEYTPEEALNAFHSITMKVYFEIICTNYIGNGMDTEFWRETRRQALEVLMKSEEFVSFTRRVVDFYDEKVHTYPDFYLHPGDMIKQYMEGFQVDFRDLSLKVC